MPATRGCNALNSRWLHARAHNTVMRPHTGTMANVTVTTTTDGYLPAALDRLYAAVAGLIDPVKEVHDGASWPRRASTRAGRRDPHHQGEGTGRRGADRCHRSGRMH